MQLSSEIPRPRPRPQAEARPGPRGPYASTAKKHVITSGANSGGAATELGSGYRKRTRTRRLKNFAIYCGTILSLPSKVWVPYPFLMKWRVQHSLGLSWISRATNGHAKRTQLGLIETAFPALFPYNGRQRVCHHKQMTTFHRDTVVQ